ncbi:MAG: esterase/lipase family protein [Acidimicrobiales bacterium]|jgi:pimeloyl-ACP methyl ester carboxylesterase
MASSQTTNGSGQGGAGHGAEPLKRPHPLLVASEAPRAVAELAWFGASRRLLARAPRGDGHPVLVLPGLMASDLSTGPMRSFLRSLGYDVVGFQLGRNLPTPELIERLRERLSDLRMSDGRAMSIIGWSLGGIYARQIAREAPDWVRLVVTLGSPFRRVAGEESVAAPLMRAMSSRRRLTRPRFPAGDTPLPVPSTSIFSRSDGIVPWRACLDTVGGPHETLEVTGSHCGLGHHPAALWAIGDRLAQPAGQWRPMEVPPTLRPLLRTHPGA